MASRKISASSEADRRISPAGIIVRAIVLFLLLEGLARVWLFHVASDETFLRYAAVSQIEPQQLLARSRFTPHRYLGFIPSPGYQQDGNRHNALGFRGEDFPEQKPLGEFRIVCIGSSTTYGAFTGSVANDDYRDSYPYRLEQALHALGKRQVRVVNSGVGGWRSWESLVNLQFRLLPLAPDLIIVYEGINDIAARLVWPPSAYRADNSGATNANLGRLFMPPVWEYSTLVRSLLVAGGQLAPQASLQRLLNRENPSTAFGNEFLQQQRNHRYPSGIFTEVPAMAMLEQNRPVYFARNIASIIDIAKANGIRVLVSGIAFDAEHFPEYPSSSSPEFVRGYREHNAVLAEVAAARGVPFVDPNAWVPRDREHFADGHHFTTRGTAVLAERLASYIDAQQLIPRE